MTLRYIWDATNRKKRMHVQMHDRTGKPLNRGLCGFTPYYSPRTINPPFTLGLPICKHCLKIAEGAS